MFELLERPKAKPIPRQLAVSGAMIGSFGLGLATGKLVMGARPVVDWAMTIGNLILMLFWTSWFAVAAARRRD